ncbi:MAG: hypothetical protein IJ758_04450 [Clostridia bacterium]|nr:hypothetical protein [Clostridia bacterium]
MERFLDLLTMDEDLRAIFLAQNSIDGAYKVAEPYLDGMTKEEFAEEMTGLARNILDSGEVTEEQLETVSGGVVAERKEVPSWVVLGMFAQKNDRMR